MALALALALAAYAVRPLDTRAGCHTPEFSCSANASCHARRLSKTSSLSSSRAGKAQATPLAEAEVRASVSTSSPHFCASAAHPRIYLLLLSVSPSSDSPPSGASRARVFCDLSLALPETGRQGRRRSSRRPCSRRRCCSSGTGTSLSVSSVGISSGIRIEDAIYFYRSTCSRHTRHSWRGGRRRRRRLTGRGSRLDLVGLHS